MKDSKKISFKLEKDLIAPSPIINRLFSLLNKEDLSLWELLDIIEKDIVISTNLLKYANSAYFGSTSKISSLQKSIELIGIIETRNISICNALMAKFNNYKFPPNFDCRKFWLHSLLTANLAKEISKMLLELGEKIDENDVYIMGLLHDIGWIAIAVNNPEDYDSISKHDQEKTAGEKSIHGLIGMTVAKMWNLPDIISDAIMYHSNPMNSPSNKTQVSLISMCSKIAIKLENSLMIDENFFDNFIQLKLNEKIKKDIIITLPQIFTKTSEIINTMEF